LTLKRKDEETAFDRRQCRLIPSLLCPALPPFKTKEGLPTNALYGFLTMFKKAADIFSPTDTLVCFDTPKPTFRDKIFKEYRQQRPKISDDLKVQFPLVRQALKAAKITYLEKDGFEADDLIGTIAEEFKPKGFQIFIFTADKDIFQLVDRNVFVVSPQRGISKTTLFDEQAVEKKLLVKPNQIPDLKALAGDPSDNYQGAKGIGPKTASKLLKEYHSLDNLLAKIETVSNPKIRKMVKENKKNILLSKRLSTIVRNVKLPKKPIVTKFNGFDPQLRPFLESLQMFSLTKKLFSTRKEPPKKTKSVQIRLI